MSNPIVEAARRLVAAAGVLAASALPVQAQQPNPRAVQPMNDLMASLATAVNSPAVQGLQQLLQQVGNYPWRTVYQFDPVSRSPAPGTRLVVKALPAMGQLDAENYVNTLGNGLLSQSMPGLNCAAAPLGGAAGRPLMLMGKLGRVAKDDGSVQYAMSRGSPTKAAETFQAYMTLKTLTCQAMYAVAQLHLRRDRFNDARAKWQQCSDEGAELGRWSETRSFDFPGNRTRHASAGGSVLFKCGATYNNTPEDVLRYDSWFKWSDDASVPLSFTAALKNASDTNGSCPGACVPVPGGAGVNATICVGLDPGVAAVTDTVPVRMGARFHVYTRDKEFCAPVMRVSAPFGIAQSLGEMDDVVKQQMVDKLKSALQAVQPLDQDVLGKLDKLADVTLF